MFKFPSESKTWTYWGIALWPHTATLTTVVGSRVWLSIASAQKPSTWESEATAGKAHRTLNNASGLPQGGNWTCSIPSRQKSAPSSSLTYSPSTCHFHSSLLFLSSSISFCLLPVLSLCSLSLCFLLAAALVFHLLLTNIILDVSVPGKPCSCTPWSLCSLATFCFYCNLVIGRHVKGIVLQLQKLVTGTTVMHRSCNCKNDLLSCG